MFSKKSHFVYNTNIGVIFWYLQLFLVKEYVFLVNVAKNPFIEVENEG